MSGLSIPIPNAVVEMSIGTRFSTNAAAFARFRYSHSHGQCLGRSCSTRADHWALLTMTALSHRRCSGLPAPRCGRCRGSIAAEGFYDILVLMRTTSSGAITTCSREGVLSSIWFSSRRRLRRPTSSKG